MKVSIYVLLSILITSCVTPLALSDEKINENIVGEWQWSPKRSLGTHVQTLRFSNNGLGFAEDVYAGIGFSNEFEWDVKGTKINLIQGKNFDGYLKIPSYYELVSHSKYTLNLKSSLDKKIRTFKRMDL